MLVPHSAIIFVNNDLTDQTKAHLMRQLHITEAIDGYVFDGYVASDPTYLTTLKETRQRLLVIRSFTELENRELADVVIFVKNALASVQENKIGPPNITHPVIRLTWGKLCIFD